MTEPEKLIAENAQIKQEILAKGSKGYLTRRQRVESAVLKFLVVAMLGLSVGYVTDRLATSDVADCTNTNLSTRNAVSNHDSDAYIAFMTSVDQAFSRPAGVTPQQIIANVKQVTASSLAQLNADKAYRTAHPLGKC